MAHIITKECTACGVCLPECPTGSIVQGAPIYLIDADTCCDSKACVAVCPADAIKDREEVKL